MDLCIVSTRRPDLLSQTVGSFSERVLVNFPINQVIANIDPVFGGEDEHKRCVEIIRNRFPKATIFEPNTSGFAAAVARVWSATADELVFHLEDDWIALQDVGVEILDCLKNPRIMQISFHTADRKWNVEKKGTLHRKSNHLRFLGLRIPLFTSFPKFSTSPSIIRGPFARRCAELMNSRFDPEKQFYGGVNRDLESYVGEFENYIYSIDGNPNIRDLGREWAASRGIKKITSAAVSRWIDKESP